MGDVLLHLLSAHLHSSARYSVEGAEPSVLKDRGLRDRSIVVDGLDRDALRARLDSLQTLLGQLTENSGHETQVSGEEEHLVVEVAREIVEVRQLRLSSLMEHDDADLLFTPKCGLHDRARALFQIADLIAVSDVEQTRINLKSHFVSLFLAIREEG